jgi:PKD repeat protein
MSVRSAKWIAFLSFVLVLALAGSSVSFASTDASNNSLEVTLSEHAAERAQTVSGSAPVLGTIDPMTLNEGTVADQVIYATDADGDPLTFSKHSGPGFMTVDTADPGTGSAIGNIHLAPTTADAGITTGTVLVSDGLLGDTASFQITVIGENVAPFLAQPANMVVKAGRIAEQTLSATDSDGDPLTFTKVSGPTYLSVLTTDPGSGTASGLARIAPSSLDVGNATAVVGVTDGSLTNQKSFSITVQANSAPFIDFISSINMTAGTTADRQIVGHDSDGDPITFSLYSGPGFLTVTTTSPGTGTATGNLHAAPSLAEVGSYNAVVRASDGYLTGDRTVFVSVAAPNRPPVLVQPADMTVTVGEIAEQNVTATDPDGNYIYITKAFGPNYMQLYNSFGGYGSAGAIVRVTPGSGDVGTATAGLSAFDGSLTDTKSFSIIVQAGNFPPSCGENSFTATSITFGYSTLEVQTADFNADGALDLLVEVPEENHISVALGNGDGSFQPATDIQAGSDPVSGAIADLNRDGKLDFVIANIGSNNVSVFLGDGNGGFGQKRDFPAGQAPRAVAVADVNRDSKLDLLVANENFSQGSVSVLRGVGDGTFNQPVSYPTGAYTFHLVTPDLNRDGAPDIVTANPGDNDITVLLNNGSGSFGQRTDYQVGSDPLAVGTGDLNGDGKADVIATSANSNIVSVFLGTGTGGLGPRKDFSAGFGPRQIAIADFNGDAIPDVGVANLESDDASIFLGNGAGSLGPRTNFPAGSGPYGVAWGDFNDDLRADLAVAGYYSGSVTLLLNECAPRPDHPPVVRGPASVSGAEGSMISFNITATDPDGPTLESLTMNASGLPIGNNAVLVPDPDYSIGVFAWTPTYMDSRAAPYTVVFTATNVLSGSWTTKITVANTNRIPTANAGGPYTGFSGSPIALDGSASSDPDGEALAFAWVFGDGTSGTGAKPMHTYTSIGIYGIALTVSDGQATALATTTANVVGLFEARAFTSGNPTIKLGAGKPQWCAQVEPIGRTFPISMVDVSSLIMKSAGTGSVDQISAQGNKVSVGGDTDKNGVEEISACFLKTDLRLLFSDLRGTNSVTVAIEGSLFTGGRFRAMMDIQVSASGGGNLAASISPNPLNPDAILTFRTEREGPARVELFDVGGRRVRSLLVEANLPVGYHDVRIDGKDDHGERLASGAYFYKISAARETQSGRLVILK